MSGNSKFMFVTLAIGLATALFAGNYIVAIWVIVAAAQQFTIHNNEKTIATLKGGRQNGTI